MVGKGATKGVGSRQFIGGSRRFHCHSKHTHSHSHVYIVAFSATPRLDHPTKKLLPKVLLAVRPAAPLAGNVERAYEGKKMINSGSIPLLIILFGSQAH